MNSGPINSQTKISVLIKANALVIDTLVAFNPHFSKLRNPILRKLLASRVTISDACKIGGCKVADFLEKMEEIGFEISVSDQSAKCEIINEHQTDIVFFRKLESMDLDVRPILAEKEDPLNLILKTVKDLKDGQCLKLINTFEPLPLINLLSKKGFKHFTERPKPNLVITWFAKGAGFCAETETDSDGTDILDEETFDKFYKSFDTEKLETIDVRGLEMPLPMVTILQHLELLPADKALFVLHKKVPVYLLSELKERGFKFLLKNTEDKKVNMLIYK